MQYYCGLSVGHCTHQRASSGSDQESGLENSTPEAPDDDDEHQSLASAVPNEHVMPLDTGEGSSTDEEHEESGSDSSLDWTDDDKDQNQDSEDDIEDEELNEMEDMYGC